MPVHDTTAYIPVENVSWDFSDQVVLVTGAAHGQGASHAQRFAEYGANLVVSDIAGEMEHVTYDLGSVSELEETAEACRSFGGECLSAVCDVRRDDQVKSLVDRAIERFGRIDVLISNAGIATPSSIKDMPLSQWTETMETNLKGSFLFCRHVVPHMIEAGTGRIVLTGSTQTVGSINDLAHYTAAKHGVQGLARALALELEGHDITVNVVCPTAVDTHINAVFSDEAWSAEAGRLVGAWNFFQEEMIHEREITEAMMWLASREVSPMSGSTLMVDAGCMAK
jgi:NAD(P)-dependent dehydrogenase (short-subunit alcohol dehydrogenase family)